jgi:uncharacterized protein
VQGLAAGALAAVAAFVAGLLGAGGDILYVPLLLYVLPAIDGAMPVHAVTALSLVGSLASTAGGGLKFWRDGRLDEAVVRAEWKPLAAGALAGGIVSRVAAADALLALFAVLTTVAVVLLVVPARPAAGPRRSRRDPVAGALLAGVGLVCGAVGVGGGFLIIIVLLHRLRLPMALASTTGLALTSFTAAPALAGKALTGQLPVAPVPFVVAGAVGGVWLGARAGAHVPVRVLRLALALLVAILSVRVWLTVLGAAG